MRKILFLSLAILLAGLMICSGCSSSDDEIKKEQPINPDDSDEPEDGSSEPSGRDLKADLKQLSENTSLKMWTCAHRSNTLKGIQNGIPGNSVEAVKYAIEPLQMELLSICMMLALEIQPLVRVICLPCYQVHYSAIT